MKFFKYLSSVMFGIVCFDKSRTSSFSFGSRVFFCLHFDMVVKHAKVENTSMNTFSPFCGLVKKYSKVLFSLSFTFFLRR